MQRRDLLRAGALGASAVLLRAGRASGASEVYSAAPSADVGVAIVGLGGYGQFVLQRTRGAVGVVHAGLVSGDAAKARELAQAHGMKSDALYSYDNFDAIAADERIDAVHICLPVGLHAEYVERALSAGKHVLCEKPLAHASSEAQRLADLAARRGLILMPAYRSWFSAHVQHVRRAVQEGVYGPLVAIDAHKGFRIAAPSTDWRFDPALAGGGCLFDIGVYSVQLCRWFAGTTPLRVQAFATHAAEPRGRAPLEDHIAFTLEFPDGVLATGAASWRYRLQNRACVATRDAWMSLDPATPVIGERLRIGLEQPNRIEEVLLPPQDQLPLMYAHFAQCIRGRAQAEVTPQEGVDDLRVMEAIYRAAQTGETTAV